MIALLRGAARLRRSAVRSRHGAATGFVRVAALLLAVCSCKDEVKPGPQPETHADPLPGFALRGRVDQPEILWTCESGLRSAVLRATRLWNDEKGNHPGFREWTVADGARGTDLQIEWRTGAHDQCMPFGTESSVAHTGPLPLPTFIHLDSEREWTESARVLTLAHELGHVLGLAHSSDTRALMYPEPTSTTPQLTAMDRRGLETLYASKEAAGADDLRITRVGGSQLLLRGVAPRDRSEFGFVEITGDGNPELAVWRTDAEGYGALTFYVFADSSGTANPEGAPRVARSIGPLYGLFAAGAELSVGFEASEPPSGVPLFILEWPDGRYGARPMAPSGRPSVRTPGPLLLVDDRQDVDGDGFFDNSHTVSGLSTQVEADVDGDGNLERVSRP